MKKRKKTSLKQRRRQRRWWVRPALQERANLGQANKLLPLLRDRDVDFYREYIRMPPRTFDTLLHLVKHHIEKKNTNFRKAISPEHRLAQTLSVPGALGCTWSYIRCPSIKCRRVATDCKRV
ncbi:uncharacterized protein LOC142776098 isoform X2 [Rhipicephalus microplus]|uniref:uncharacterized protein LOC142776098 isoform X2 n=1 Tax=Rhipicephalus microplus TaxID=6941 RepID=UPI003F6CF31E